MLLQEFSNSRPLDERVTISQNAINELLPQLNSATGEFNGEHFPRLQVHQRFYQCKILPGIGYWQSGNVWSAMANHDHFAGTTTYQSQVISNMKTVFNLRADYDQYGYVTSPFRFYRPAQQLPIQGKFPSTFAI